MPDSSMLSRHGLADKVGVHSRADGAEAEKMYGKQQHHPPGKRVLSFPCPPAATRHGLVSGCF